MSTGSANQIVPAPAHTVYLKQTWDDDWEAQDFLYADWFEFLAGPDFDKAQLSWKYGIGFQAGSAVQETVAPWPQTVKGWYVMIVVDPSTTNTVEPWYGRVAELLDDQAGVLTGIGEDGPFPAPSGKQTFSCFGLGYELDKTTVLTSQVVDPDDDDDPLVINRSIGWNLGQGWDERDHGDIAQGNRSKTTQYQSTYVFAQDLSAANSALWRTTDIAKYLLLFYAAQSQAGDRTLPWAYNPGPGTNALAGYQHRLRGQGRTVWRILNDLLDRRRGVGAHVTVNVGDGPDDTDQPVLNVHSLTPSTITFPDGSQLAANASTITLDMSNDPWAHAPQIRSSEVTQYDQVVVRGHRRGSVFTISQSDASMTADWTDAQLAQWNAGWSGEADYAAMVDDQKRLRNDEIRTQPGLERVMSWYRLPADWDGAAGDGVGGDETNPAFPALTPYSGPGTGVVTGENIPTWIAGLRLERHLPITTDVDYSGDHIANGTAVAALPAANSLAEHVPLLVAARLYNLNADGTQNDEQYRYILLDRASIQGATGAGQGLPKWSASVRVQQNCAGLVLQVHGSERRCGQVLIGKELYAPPDVPDQFAMGLEQAVSSFSILATVYVKNDAYVEVRQPYDSELADTPGIRQLMISVHDAYLDYVVPQTVVAIDNHGALVRSETGGFVRDDRPRLMAIAQLAAAWYLQPRNVCNLSFRRVYRYASVGQMIASVGNSEDGTQQTVNTVVSRVRYDLNPTPGTTIQTSHGELDLRI